MIYSLDIRVVSNNQTILDAIENKVPAKLDNKMWAEEYEVTQGLNNDGNKCIDIMVRFNEDAERQTILNWMKTKAQNVQADILTGSYVAKHRCDHDLGNGRTGCGPKTIIWSK